MGTSVLETTLRTCQCEASLKWVCRKLRETGVVQPWSDNPTLRGEHGGGPEKVCCVSITKETMSSFA
ncbi:hypothetical protein HispidOSU_001636, partial [Sigmodon hispidus]